MTKRSKVFIAVGVSVCLAFGIAGCVATTEEQGAQASPSPTAIATATVAPTATSSASVAPDVKSSAAPSATVSATQEVIKPTGNSGEKNRSQGQNGKTDNKTQQAGKGQQEAPNTNVAPAPENPAPAQGATTETPSSVPTSKTAPEQMPAPAPTPPPAPTPEPPQSGYAYCSCGAKLDESEIMNHMKQHAINGESCSYTTY